MSLLTILFALCALLAAPILAQAAEVERTVALAELKGANPADCAEANSDYERYELGCPVDAVAGSAAATNGLPSD